MLHSVPTHPPKLDLRQRQCTMPRPENPKFLSRQEQFHMKRERADEPVKQ